MGCLLSCIACCFCDAAASLCCKCLPSCRNSTSTRLVYGLILVVVLILSCICLSPDIENWLKKIPSLCPGDSDDLCQVITGYGAVYRMCFGLVSFFLIFSVCMIDVKTSLDYRASIHNGFWFFKILAILGIMIGAFFIRDPSFLYVWMVFGFIGAGLYILVQLILFIDLAYNWNKKWVDGYEETGKKIYLVALSVFTFLFYAASVTAIVLFYVYFASAPTCHLGKMVVSINLILCVIASIVSTLDIVREKQPTSGILQSSIITAYIMFLTWSALVNIPDVKCNPTLRTTNVTSVVNGTTVTLVTADLSFNWQTAFSLVILIFSVVYACFRNSSNNVVGRLSISGGVDTKNAAEARSRDAETTDRGGQTVWDNEVEGVAYSYAMFHFLMVLATFFVMMSITNWYKPDKRTSLLSANYASFWVKATSSWVCAAIYIWTLVGPIIFPDRDFT